MSAKGSTSTQSTSTTLPVALLASTVGGGIEPLVSYPFEFIKTNQQLHVGLDSSKFTPRPSNAEDYIAQQILRPNDPAKQRTGFTHIIRHVWKNEGIKGFYHGVGVVASGGAAKVSE